MSSQEKKSESQINLNPKNNQKEIETENNPQKKTDIQFPSSTIASTQNQDTIKTGTIIPEFLNSNNNTNEANNKLNYFQSKKIDFSENDNNTNINVSDKISCYCTKTRCIKKYCECYSNNRYCKNCHCINCLNKFSHLGNELQKENNKVFCTCTKSNCNKKYCECYKANQKCTSKCRCVNCKNCNPQSIFNFSFTTIKREDIINTNINNNSNIKYNDINNNINNSSENLCDNNNDKNEVINLEEKEENERNNSKQLNSRKSSLDSNESFQIQRVSVYINKNETIIDVEKFNKEMTFTSKKEKKVK